MRAPAAPPPRPRPGAFDEVAPRPGQGPLGQDRPVLIGPDAVHEPVRLAALPPACPATASQGHASISGCQRSVSSGGSGWTVHVLFMPAMPPLR